MNPNQENNNPSGPTSNNTNPVSLPPPPPRPPTPLTNANFGIPTTTPQDSIPPLNPPKESKKSNKIILITLIIISVLSFLIMAIVMIILVSRGVSKTTISSGDSRTSSMQTPPNTSPDSSSGPKDIGWMPPQTIDSKWSTVSSTPDAERAYKYGQTSCTVLFTQPAGIKRAGVTNANQVISKYAKDILSAVNQQDATFQLSDDPNPPKFRQLVNAPSNTSTTDIAGIVTDTNTANLKFTTQIAKYPNIAMTAKISATIKDDYALINVILCKDSEYATNLPATTAFVEQFTAVNNL